MIKVKKLHPDAFVPQRSNETDAGLDLVSLVDMIIPPLRRVTVSTGISVAIPEGHAGLVWPRSGLAVKHGIDTMAGVIDSGYRGEVKVVLYNTDEHFDFQVEKGARIAQLVIQPIVSCSAIEVSELDDTDRGEDGFGSSGV